MRNKLFPYYDESTLIFGNDRATRKWAKIETNVVEELDVEETNKIIYSLDETNTSTSNTMSSREEKEVIVVIA